MYRYEKCIAQTSGECRPRAVCSGVDWKDYKDSVTRCMDGIDLARGTVAERYDRFVDVITKSFIESRGKIQKRLPIKAFPASGVWFNDVCKNIIRENQKMYKVFVKRVIRSEKQKSFHTFCNTINVSTGTTVGVTWRMMRSFKNHRRKN